VSFHTVNLQVAPLPVAYASDLGACPESFDGPTAVFNLNSVSAQVTGNTSGLTVTYHLSQSDANLGINPLPSVYTSADKQIWARVQNAAGCYDVDALQLNVHGSPGVVLTAQDNTCSGAQQGAVTAIIFDGPADYTFTWSNGTVQGPTATHSATLNSLNAGTYAVTLTDGNGCTATASAQVNDASAFSIIPIPDYHVEAGSQVGPIVLQTSTWGANFTWTGGLEVGMPNGSTTAMMPLIPVFTAQLNSATVTVNATLGACTSTTQFTVNVTDNTPPTAVCQDITVALGSDGSVAITPVQVNGGSTDSYASLNDLTLSISTANFTAANLGANNVTLTVTDPSGNTASCVAIVTVLAEQGFAPTASFSDVQLQKCMAPFEIRFTDHSVGNPTAWFWTFPGGTPATSTEQNPVVVFNTPGYYVVTLEVSNDYGTHQLSKECQVLYAGMPEADFAYGVDGMNVSFANFTQNATHYVWHFGDGNVSEETSPTHEYEHPGTYLVQLTADNECSAHVFEQWVTVSSPTSGTQDQGWLEDFRLFPNPNTGTFTVAMLGQTKGNGEVQFVLFDALGQIVHREQGDFRSGHLVQVFEYGNLPAAVYTLGIQDGQQVKYVKVVVQR
jgi:PKD repeat protein